MNTVLDTSLSILKNCFGGINVELLSEDLERIESTSDKWEERHGKIGAFFNIEGTKLFIPHRLMEDMLVYGENIANEIVWLIVKEKYLPH